MTIAQKIGVVDVGVPRNASLGWLKNFARVIHNAPKIGPAVLRVMEEEVLWEYAFKNWQGGPIEKNYALMKYSNFQKSNNICIFFQISMGMHFYIIFG